MLGDQLVPGDSDSEPVPEDTIGGDTGVASKPDLGKLDSIEETLICQICQV